MLSFLGASGSGKSMILRCIAGVETPDSGIIIVDDKILFDHDKNINLPIIQRKTGLLFQDFALFPTMTVKENLEIVAKSNQLNKGEVSNLLKTYDLVQQENLYPADLSGGQKQRCAIARILLTSPDIILLDEPFSSLDSFLKQRLEKELFAYLKKYHKTVIFVSHNREEVYRQSQKVSVIINGKTSPMIEKKQLFQSPETVNTALLIGCENIISLLEFPDILSFLQSIQAFQLSETQKKSAHVCIFAQNFQFQEDGSGDHFAIEQNLIFFTFQVVDVVEGAFSVHYTVKPEGFNFLLVVELHKSINLCNSKGVLSIKLEDVLLLKKEDN
ncbi:MAG: ATP-binding cassette domain-containing protein [Eubacteriales bacterium]